MLVRRTLQINAVVSVIAAVVVLLMLSLSLQRIRIARVGVELASNIISATFESSTFRYDYLQSGSQRAKKQWYAAHAKIHKLITQAARRSWGAEDQAIVTQLQEDHESVGKLFSAIVSGREQGSQTGTIANIEIERRLQTQLVMRTYDTVQHARKLQESSREHLFNAINLAGISLVLIVAVMVLAMTFSSLSLNRLIATRMTRLQQGATAIGEGDLSHQIGLHGDDEFVQLSETLDGMACNLHRSYLDLEREVNERRQAEEALAQAKAELEVRVEERTIELSKAMEDLRNETAERFLAVKELHKKEQMLMQQNRLAAMGEMLVNISHQWRQPLNIVGLLLQELARSYKRGTFTEEMLEKNVIRARELITHMSQTIDDFRNFLRPEKNKVAFDLQEVIEKAISMIGETLKDIVVQVQSESAVMVEGYRNEFSQVIMNILINSRDAFRERRIANPRIAVKIFKDNSRKVVTIADNAGGIAPEIIDRIFDPYFTTKGPDKGTGIGLFMSKAIIESSMKGSLMVTNTDEGAEFRIEV